MIPPLGRDGRYRITAIAKVFPKRLCIAGGGKSAMQADYRHRESGMSIRCSFFDCHCRSLDFCGLLSGYRNGIAGN